MTRTYNSRRGTTQGKRVRYEIEHWKNELPFFHIDWFQRPPAKRIIKQQIIGEIFV
jgi:hypothetical protein